MAEMMAWGKWKSPKTAQRYYEDAPVTKDVHESRLSFDTQNSYTLNTNNTDNTYLQLYFQYSDTMD